VHGVNAFGSLYWSLLAAGVALLIAVVFEIRLALSLGRDPDSRVLSAIVKDFVPPAGRRRVGAAGWAAALAAYQLFPLSQERLFAGNLPPDHIAGAGVILAEIAFAAYIWRCTRAGSAG